MNIGEPEISASVAERKSLVIEAHQMKHRGVEVVRRNRILNRLESKVVGAP